jgi:8-oxo-dGTP diphosphatase
VEPGENPADTVRSEARGELGIEADFSVAGDRPAFLTVTPHGRARCQPHGLSLWYLISGNRQTHIALDRREFAGGRWWTPAEISAAGQALFDPHFSRFLTKIRSELRFGAPEGRKASDTDRAGVTDRAARTGFRNL